MNNIDAIAVFITTSSIEEAKKISSLLVDENLVACTNIVSSVQSIFMWKGNLCDESESLIIAKTRLDLFDKLESKVKKLHSYEVPEIIALPIIKGNNEYLKWIKDETLTK